MSPLIITTNRTNAASIESHLRECDERFSPQLSIRLNISKYSQKLASLADRFEAWRGHRLVGFVAAYLNNTGTCLGFVSSISICKDFEGKGVASKLMRKCALVAEEKGCKILELEVSKTDQRARAFYLKHGFVLSAGGKSGFLLMRLDLAQNDRTSQF
jgi:ribosomal protein S18 acetylase RimI-like enzyme